jgi:RTX calcium-binding nonapeptide repeat (4 copies)
VSVACFAAATGLSAADVGANAERAGPLKRIIGTGKANVLRGTPKPDFIDGRAGNDVLYGFAGDDRLIGGAGADRIICGRGRDTVSADRRDTVARDCEVVRGGRPPPPPPPPVVPEQLLGVWNRFISDPTIIGASHVGLWSLKFDRDGTLAVIEPVGAHVPGVRDTFTVGFSATPDGQLVVDAGPGCGTRTVFSWEIAEAALRIRKVSVDCPLPAAVIPGDWSR